jgi:hypothetical protein
MTSIEWLWDKIKKSNSTCYPIEKLIEQAKQMHKREIMEAYFSGGHNMKNGHYIGMKEYYEITFKPQ